MMFGRLLMRVLLMPLGGAIAICVAMLVVLVAHCNRIAAAGGDEVGGLALLVAAPALALAIAFMLLPAALGALIAEAFAIRSWIYHAGNGGLSAWVSLVAVGALDKTYDFTDEPLIAIGAGIAAGFAYWVVAGSSAGFWKPVFGGNPADEPPATPLP